MDERVRVSLLKIADDFLNGLQIDIDPSDIVLTGSCANYNWNSTSDVDLHILVPFKKIKVDNKILSDYLYDACTLWNDRHKVTMKGFQVQIYVQDVTEKLPYSSGVFSLERKKWLQEPILIKDPDDKYIAMKSKPWIEKIEKGIESANKQRDLGKATAEIEALRVELRKFRVRALTSGGEHSINNLVFKHIRKTGVLKKLIDTSRIIYDKSVSVTEAKIALAEMTSWV
jgi:predicted nucleotidyltransferase